MTKIGIVGGSGFVGGYLTNYLCRKYDIKILDTKPPKEISDDVEYCNCDIRNINTLKRGFKDLDLIIHTAIIQIPLINEMKQLGYEVNIIGTQNVCKLVHELPNIKGMILTSSWHVMGERELKGIIDEKYGLRPDKVEDRARLYAISKICQESITRIFSEMSEKIFSIIRLGTVLGLGMPEKTAANIFIENGIRGKKITPFKHSMYRPMLYVDINDVCVGFMSLIDDIIENSNKHILNKSLNSLEYIYNFYYPQPITIFDLSMIIRNIIMDESNNKIKPDINIVDQGIESLFNEKDKSMMTIDLGKTLKLFNLTSLTHPRDSLRDIVREKMLNFRYDY